MYHKSQSFAFSLVELSIVLVILGLLIGGVLSGQALIHAAELRRVVQERGQIVTAIQTFRDRYFDLPGDFTKATQFWGRQYNDASCVTNSGSGVVTTGACDGDGNGRIDPQMSTGFSEVAQLWLHLTRAGLINCGPISGQNVTGQDCFSKYPNMNWSLRYSSNAGGDPTMPDNLPPNQNVLIYGHEWGNGQAPISGGLPPPDAWNIDAKIDDGKPTTGAVQSNNNWAPPPGNCYDNGAYLLQHTDYWCALLTRAPL